MNKALVGNRYITINWLILTEVWREDFYHILEKIMETMSLSSVQ